MKRSSLSRPLSIVTWTLPAIVLGFAGCGDPAPSGNTTSSSSSSGTAGMAGAGGSGGMETGGSGGTGGSGVLCGNGKIDAMETCDTAIAAGLVGACVTAGDCNDNVACTTDSVKGGGTCGAVCQNDPITTCAAGDGCCPFGCDAMSDSDCSTTCGDGKLDAGETCDTAIMPGASGGCPQTCDDGKACTHDTLLNAGNCSAQCLNEAITMCVNGDGCCPLGCANNDTDCVGETRIKQSVITDSGQTAWARNGYWDGMGYTSFTGWSGQSMLSLVPNQGSSQAYRGIDYVVLPDGRLKATYLQMDGQHAWYRYATWNGTAYTNWTAFTNQFGDLTQIIPNQGTMQAFRSFDHVVFPDGKLQQSLLAMDGKTLWKRKGTWDPNTMTYTWAAFASTDISGLVADLGAGQTFRSFNQVVFPDKRMKQAVLTEDGHTVWYRYGTWDAAMASYPMWSAWSKQYGNLTSLLPGQGTNQAYLTWDESTMGGAGSVTNCQNGCDDGDPCTTDACVANACEHVAITCDDGNACTADVCIDGMCQSTAKTCDDGNACTDDVCSNGTCFFNTKSCDDGNPCTDDSCSGGSCGHSNNSASCPGGTCSNGTCQQMMCSCNNCKDTCTNAPCNPNTACAPNATCQNGTCACTTLFCGNACCNANETCNGGKCCPTKASGFCGGGKCGIVNGPPGCPAVDCGTNCPGTFTCCNNQCEDICAP